MNEPLGNESYGEDLYRDLVCKAFGASLQRLRRKTKIIQENLAFQAGVDRGYLSGLERGKNNPSWFVAVKLMKSMNVSMAQLGAEWDRSYRNMGGPTFTTDKDTPRGRPQVEGQRRIRARRLTKDD